MRDEEAAAEIDVEQMAEHDGLEAFVAGDGMERNPFTPNSPLHLLWEKGWKTAEAHHEHD